MVTPHPNCNRLVWLLRDHITWKRRLISPGCLEACYTPALVLEACKIHLLGLLPQAATVAAFSSSRCLTCHEDLDAWSVFKTEIRRLGALLVDRDPQKRLRVQASRHNAVAWSRASGLPSTR